MKVRHRLLNNLFWLGLSSLIWWVLRTGAKPSRGVYPCQQVAAANSWLWISLYILPLFSTIKNRIPRLLRTRSLIYLPLALVIIISLIMSLNASLFSSDLTAINRSVNLDLQSQVTMLSPASDIFVINGTSGNDGGVINLINLMGTRGTLFYQSPRTGFNQGPSGLISADDVIIIKINCQWDERGGTNTDVLKSVIQAILLHPDGFNGEIIVADNGQAQNGPEGEGGSLEYNKNNAEDTAQSVQKVVDSFSGTYRISTYLWDTITNNRVREYSEGDDEDGYIAGAEIDPFTGLLVSYPKFKTQFDTHISFKMGIWDPIRKTYNSQRLKIINLPVLKSHKEYGVSAAVKNYMGVTSARLTRELGADSHFTIGEGGMGKQMAETRFPVLNIIDAIWVNTTPGTGPYTSYDMATRTNVIAASSDPFALDYYAAKYILVPAARKQGIMEVSRIDPDNVSEGSFGDWLRKSRDEAVLSGRQATVDEAYINIFVSRLEEAIPAASPASLTP